MKWSIKNPEYLKYRNATKEKVWRDQKNFMKFYDQAAKAVFSGQDKLTVINEMAPWGCELTQSNGVVAGANQAAQLMKRNG